jgi:hypothetical protein
LVGTRCDRSGNIALDINRQSFTYDAENKQVQVSNVTGIIGRDGYDVYGKRIKKVMHSTGQITIFVDAAGKIVAEYSAITVSRSNDKINFLTNDHLGSPRIMTDINGQTIARRNFMPFGMRIALYKETVE